MELACKFKGDVDELMVLRESVRNLVEEISSR
jgi:hypothetical protein